MGSYFRDDEHRKMTFPRPDPAPILKDDTRTGNAIKDGYTALGPRRPRGAQPGDIMDAEDARRRDEMDEAMESWSPVGYMDW